MHSILIVLQAQATWCTAECSRLSHTVHNILGVLQAQAGHSKSLALAFSQWTNPTCIGIDITLNVTLFIFSANEDLGFNSHTDTPMICNLACSWCSCTHEPLSHPSSCGNDYQAIEIRRLTGHERGTVVRGADLTSFASDSENLVLTKRCRPVILALVRPRQDDSKL